MAKKIEFIFDFNSKDVQIASERTLTLAQQVRVLKQELQKTKEGTAEFEILKNKLNETKDNFDRVNAKSRELFGTLSLIPGPIGDIASKIDGTISLFKTFSGFKFKDIASQFSALGADLAGIGSNIAKATGLSKVFATTTTIVSKALKLVGIEATTASIGVRAFSAALIGTGIGAIVVGLGLLVEAFISAGNETDKYTDKLEKLNAEIAFNRNAAKRRAEEEVAEAKARGASEDELAAIRKKNNDILIKDLEKTAKIREQESLKAASLYGAESEQYKNARKEQINADKELADARSQVRIDDFNEQARVLKQNQDNAQKAADKEKQRREKAAQENKQFRQEDADAEVQILKNSEDTKEEELRKALQKQYAIKNEGKKISKNIQQAQAEEIEKIVQEEIKRDKEAREKAQQEKEENEKNFSRKIADIRIAAIADETQREIATREEKLKRELEDLQKDKEFLKLSEEERAKIIKQLRQAAQNDLDTINKNVREKEKNDRLKGLDDQLKFLDLQFSSVLKGTEEYFNLRAEQLAVQQQKELEGVEKGSKEEIEILKKYAALKKQLKDEEIQATGQLISATLDAFAGLGNAIASIYDEEAKTSEEAFNKRKKLQKATALISAASGIVQILTQPSTIPSPFDWIVKGVNAAALAVATGVQISKINATQFEGGGTGGNEQPRRLASGGIVVGPGGPKDDRVPTLLSNGESVINARSTELFRPLLSKINEIGGGRRFANGGIVSTNYTQQQALNEVNSTLGLTSTQPIKTYVVAGDMTSQQMFDRAQKSRSTL
jgi:hypothetical protein